MFTCRLMYINPHSSVLEISCRRTDRQRLFSCVRKKAYLAIVQHLPLSQIYLFISIYHLFDWITNSCNLISSQCSWKSCWAAPAWRPSCVCSCRPNSRSIQTRTTVFSRSPPATARRCSVVRVSVADPGVHRALVTSGVSCTTTAVKTWSYTVVTSSHRGDNSTTDRCLLTSLVCINILSSQVALSLNQLPLSWRIITNHRSQIPYFEQNRRIPTQSQISDLSRG